MQAYEKLKTDLMEDLEYIMMKVRSKRRQRETRRMESEEEKRNASFHSNEEERENELIDTSAKKERAEWEHQQRLRR